MPATPFVKTVLGDTPYIVSFSDDLGHTWSADEPTEVGGGNTGRFLWPVSRSSCS